jgi:hypothetical protein
MILTSAGVKPGGLIATEIFIPKPFDLDRVVALVMKSLASTNSVIK